MCISTLLWIEAGNDICTVYRNKQWELATVCRLILYTMLIICFSLHLINGEMCALHSSISNSISLLLIEICLRGTGTAHKSDIALVLLRLGLGLGSRFKIALFGAEGKFSWTYRLLHDITHNIRHIKTKKTSA